MSLENVSRREFLRRALVLAAAAAPFVQTASGLLVPAAYAETDTDERPSDTNGSCPQRLHGRRPVHFHNLFPDDSALSLGPGRRRHAGRRAHRHPPGIRAGGGDVLRQPLSLEERVNQQKCLRFAYPLGAELWGMRRICPSDRHFRDFRLCSIPMQSIGV